VNWIGKIGTGLLVLLVSMAVGPLTSTGNAEGNQVVGPNGHLYRRIDTGMTWRNARDYCASLGAHLVTIGSQEENQFVYELLPWGWLGATDEVTEGVWEWVTGEPWTFEYWAPAEPNNCCPPSICGGTECTPEHYLTFWGGQYTSRWNDVPDGASYFVCEWDFLIDIKPGSYPNSINLGSHGVVPVAVLTTDGSDASTLDPVTVVFAGAAPLRWAMEDVDSDGDLDLIFHFKIQELNLYADSTDAALTGQTFNEVPVERTDTVNIVP
jgi:hypothetical protein